MSFSNILQNLFGGIKMTGGQGKPDMKYIVKNDKQRLPFAQRLKQGFTGRVPANTMSKIEPVQATNFKPINFQSPEPKHNVFLDLGRVAQNPFPNEMEEIFGKDKSAFEKVLRWALPTASMQDKYGTTFGGENLDFETRKPEVNKDGTRDFSLFRINEPTFNDFRVRMNKIHDNYFDKAGIKTYEDLADPRKSMIFARAYESEMGNRWYGASKTAPGRERWENAPYEYGQRISTQPFNWDIY